MTAFTPPSITLPNPTPDWIYEGVDPAHFEDATGPVTNRAPKQIQSNIQYLVTILNTLFTDLENFDIDGGTAAALLNTIQIRRSTAAEWTANNPILSIGELGWEKDTGAIKVGDGVTHWNSLTYNFGSFVSLTGDQTINGTKVFNGPLHITNGLFDHNDVDYYVNPSQISTMATIRFDGTNNTGGGYWNLGHISWPGQAPALTGVDSVAGILYTGGTGSQLFTIGSEGPGVLSVQIDGSIFLGDNITFNPTTATGTTNGSIVAKSDIVAGGSVYSHGDAHFFANAYCGTMYDKDNNAYYVHPSGNTILHNLSVDTLNVAGVAAITAAAFSGSITTNGYIPLPGGLLFQWGRYRFTTNSVGTVYTVPYNISFSAAAFSVTLVKFYPSAHTYNQKIIAKIGDGTGSGFQYALNDDDSADSGSYSYGFDWFAIGPA